MFSCTSKETISKIQPTEWEKIIANETTDRINLQNIKAAHAAQHQKKINSPIKKWVEDLNRNFSIKKPWRWLINT